MAKKADKTCGTCGRPATVEDGICSDFDEPLRILLDQAFEIVDRNDTALLLLEDMYDINEHFQAVLDWFKEHGNRMVHRWGQGCKMTSGWLYFCGADTHLVPTRGVGTEIDLREVSNQLVRRVGLEARLREKGLA